MKRNLFRSECGGFFCRASATRGWGSFEVWSADGKTHWRCDDRIKCWADNELAWHPFEFCTGGFSAEKMGQKAGSFTVTLLHCDTGKVIIPWTGNTVIESRDVVFRRRVPPQNWPKFLRSPARHDYPLERLADDGCRLAA
jgi:hypothetical protein